MDLIKEIGQFLWAVLTIWQAYMTGGIVIALLGIYERLMQKTVSIRTFLIGVLAFLLVALFLAWRDQLHRGNELSKQMAESTRLAGEIQQVIWGYTPELKSTQIFCVLSIKNLGLPTIVEGYGITANFPDGH